MRRHMKDDAGRYYARVGRISGEAAHVLGGRYLAVPVGWGDATPNGVGATAIEAWEALRAALGGELAPYDGETSRLIGEPVGVVRWKYGG